MSECHDRGTGKWRKPGVPQRGWICVDVEDLGVPVHTCEMCEVMVVRFVHTMEHPDHSPLAVGCVCAGNMEGDLVGAHLRETTFRKRQLRRKTWLVRPWRVSKSGNDYLNTGGFNIVVYPTANHWGARVLHRESQWERSSQRRYASADDAKLAALDAMLEMKVRVDFLDYEAVEVDWQRLETR